MANQIIQVSDFKMVDWIGNMVILRTAHVEHPQHISIAMPWISESNRYFNGFIFEKLISPFRLSYVEKFCEAVLTKFDIPQGREYQ